MLAYDGVLDAAAGVQPHGHGHHVEGQHVFQQGLGGDAGTVRRTVDEVHEVERVGAVEAATDADPGEVEGAHVDPLAHQALQGLEGVHAGQLEVGLDAIRHQPLEVLRHPGRAGRHRHFAVGRLVGGVRQRGARQVLGVEQLHDVHLGGVDGDRDLIRLRGQLGQHVAGVIGEPLGRLALPFRREGDGAADLDDHVGHRLAHPGDQLVELGQPLGAGAVQLAHVQVQHCGTRLVAVDRLLDLLLHGHRNVFREVAGGPLWAIGGHCDDHLFHVFRVQGIVKKLHLFIP
ncbi:hypothetical protein D3C80_745040 [compost metagenome]